MIQRHRGIIASARWGAPIRQADDHERVYRIPDPDLLPRYRFHQTAVGCKEHRNPYCFCDVKLPAEPTPVSNETLVFGGLALQVTGPLTERNFVQFAELYLGMWETERILKDVPPVTAGGNNHTGNTTPWTELDDTVRCKMQAAYRERMPWSQAKLFLPETTSPAAMRYLSKYYNQRLYSKTTAHTTTKETS